VAIHRRFAFLSFFLPRGATREKGKAAMNRRTPKSLLPGLLSWFFSKMADRTQTDFPH
jgi:hypothetical protein